MFSGKTEELIRRLKRVKIANLKVEIFKPMIDKRYHDTMVSSHDKVLAPCIQTSQLGDVKSDLLEKYDVILINEGQFFGDLSSVVIELLQSRKKVYVCGLDGDFRRKKFGNILDLIPMCDKITKLTSLCSKCRDGTPGIFSMRLTDSTNQTMVGSDSYIPVCRKCYES
jgi:thymidine kinase